MVKQLIQLENEIKKIQLISNKNDLMYRIMF